MKAGLVSLVGAGPGDPDLLTRKAARRLAQADLVLYDALVSPDTLALAARAQRFYVGKRCRRHAMAQETIHRLMVRAARRGKRVVRLKGGDPFVFGRGGEEALALKAEGVPFEVVPGVSSAVAAPALSGIPVTHRGLSSAFTVVSGHDEAAWRPIVEGLPPGGSTLVFLMGLGSRERLAAALRARGWIGRTPCAILLGASTPEAWTWTGRLDELGDVVLPEARSAAPGTLVVGEVVSVGAALAAVPESSREPAVAGGAAARRSPWPR
ncbi:MAG TPA: uroporphyrinogen-III C-methyltransferase [Vicinamibacteria bacterium]|nr:uroporphyrinogen-III C-methyltransferase [Vicinamibacteria bacterium]